ncbi:MAG: hypothetical protein V1822_01285, partial [Candidatus Micrarchaeota archaeon]
MDDENNNPEQAQQNEQNQQIPSEEIDQIQAQGSANASQPTPAPMAPIAHEPRFRQRAPGDENTIF